MGIFDLSKVYKRKGGRALLADVDAGESKLPGGERRICKGGKQRKHLLGVWTGCGMRSWGLECSAVTAAALPSLLLLLCLLLLIVFLLFPVCRIRSRCKG